MVRWMDWFGAGMTGDADAENIAGNTEAKREIVRNESIICEHANTADERKSKVPGQWVTGRGTE